MATAELFKGQKTFGGGNDSIIIARHVADLPGGATLDTTGFTDPTIKAGHVIYKDAEGNYKPVPVTDGAYTTIDGSYVGVVIRSVPTTMPVVAILTAGQVNAKASPFPVTDEIATALPRIEFLYK